MGFLKKVLKKSGDYFTDTGKSLAAGDLKGTVVNAGKAAMNVGTFGQIAAIDTFLNPDIPGGTAQPATLTPVDPNALTEQQMLEEQKRRARLPGRSQFVLNRSSYQTPSLLGDNSVLSPTNKLV